MAQVPGQKITFASTADFAKQVFAAFQTCGLTDEPAAMLTAHVALSTGWGRSVWNYALAGIKAGSAAVCRGEAQPTYKGDYACLKGFEYISGKRVVAVMPFRTYPSLQAGAGAILKLLQTKRYQKSYAMLLAGDQRYFEQVGLDGWYTDNIQKTAAGMRARLIEVKKFVGLAPDSEGGSFELYAAVALFGSLLYLLLR